MTEAEAIAQAVEAGKMLREAADVLCGVYGEDETDPRWFPASELHRNGRQVTTLVKMMDPAQKKRAKAKKS